MKIKILAAILTMLCAVFAVAPTAEAACRNTGSFSGWLDGFKREAAAAGISGRTISAALRGVSFDPAIIRRDRAQRIFTQDFLTFATRMVEKYRVPLGRKKIRQNKALFSRMERKYGVPAAIVAAFWGLETDFGAGSGDFSIIRSLATLAYDCRRPEKFRPELMAALRIVERGDLSVSQMKGNWAGEIGQTQFQPSHYYNYGVDFDGDGRRDLRRSRADVFATTANFLRGHGWRSGKPWLTEVRVPAAMPWDQADLAIKHPRAAWAKWGVKLANGRPLRADAMKASLILPMGRNGPAFLAYANFNVFLEWNESLVYATTAAYYATRLAGAKRISRGRARVAPMGYDSTRRLQQRLAARGHDVGKIDGIIGAKTRAAVKAVQLKLGLPADSYPTPDLVRRLR